MRNLILAVTITLLPSLVSAAEESTRSLSKEFVALMRYSEQYVEYHRQCLASAKSVSPDVLARQNPDRFYGIRPGSAIWPEVIKAYDRYYEKACARPTQDEFLAAMASAYAAELSLMDLRSAIEFYSSSIGQRLIGAHMSAARNVYQEWHRLNAKQIPVADREFDRRMSELSKQSRKK